ncbi:hypothetical protein NDI76_20235 [Halogeometricum sp. S1BR25-6]|uniref:DUF4040 domain-containing protein n=1 Tax=Halogeometricum salsisoli TaxID=2950536 RepID=A0ABU2GKZ6_9EURY|nr:hypothetical protein [Halogeometricum sp. S1BR25-6]MDS0301071.1 hypothetical protein [Halogeometricum sp. S1BR25-6]
MISLPIVLVKLFVLILSLAVAYLAFYAYQRSRMYPMVYVSIGFIFIGVGAICEGLIYSVLNTSLLSAAVVQAGLVSIGMIFILRSIMIGPSQEVQ